MRSGNLLGDVWEAYQTTIDCLKVASRSVAKCEYHLLNRTNLVDLTQDMATERIGISRLGADEYVILSLWTIFERQLYHYLKIQCDKMLCSNGSGFNQKVHKKLHEGMEYWKIEDILDIYKVIVSPDLIGHAKQIKKYRDWIAHRNPKKGPPASISPRNAFAVLSTILGCLEQHPDLFG